MKYLMLGAAALALTACGNETANKPDASADEVAVAVEETVSDALPADEVSANEAALDEILALQPEDVKARYQYRHPKDTLMFFGIEPGMVVVDTLPGNPWYSGILLDYLGPDGKVIGADYSPEMWSLFGQFAPPEGAKDGWVAEWTETAEGWRDDDSDAGVGAVQFGHVPEDMAGTVDVVLEMRALHHFFRLEDEGGFRTQALADMMTMLKPGGVVGVVQHRSPEGNADEWATGDNGYLKQSAVIAAFEDAGFELVETSEVNANPKDQPTEEDFVWRLPPTLATSGDDPELRTEMEAIGESDRMTLLFRKPAE